MYLHSGHSMGMPYLSSLSLEDMSGLLRSDIGDGGGKGDAGGDDMGDRRGTGDEGADDIGDGGVEGMLEGMCLGGVGVGGEDCKLGVCCRVEGVVCEFGGGVGGEFCGGVKV